METKDIFMEYLQQEKNQCMEEEQHLIQDERDYRHHVDYVHRNPLKHGLVERVVDWPYSSFHRAVGAGVYPAGWCGDEAVGFAGDAD